MQVVVYSLTLNHQVVDVSLLYITYRLLHEPLYIHISFILNILLVVCV
jgi:hypothetical protein